MPDSTNDELTLDDMVAFLCGEKSIRGIWYGEKYEGMRMFWWRSELRQLIHQHTEQAKKQGFYMGCRVSGIHEPNVESLWEECIVQLTTNPKGGDQK